VPKSDTRSSGDWLSLHEASLRLHVHAGTLRLWADHGRIRTFRTPGGHRRFSEADVDALAGQASPQLALLMNAAVGQARLATSAGQLASEPWYSRFDEVAKAKQRVLGHDLMRLLVGYLGQAGGGTDGVQSLGDRYARLAHEVGLTLGDAMRAFHLFEDVVHASVGQLSSAQAGGSPDLDRRVGWFLNEVRIAMVEAFRQDRR
jgi:excisionase family DNA binding protein